MIVEDPSVLTLHVGPIEYTIDVDENTTKIVRIEEETIKLRHSLKSVRYWEQLTRKSWILESERGLSNDDLTLYIKCMVINDLKNPDIIKYLNPSDLNKIHEHINDPMSATTFGKGSDKPRRRKKVTCEEIYAALTSYGMPIDMLENWHFNQVNILIRTRSELENPTGKTTMADKYKINAARQARIARRPH